HGEFTVAAMYAAYLLFTLLGIDPLVAMVPIALAFFAIGYTLQVTLVHRFVGRAEHEQFILLVGLAIIIVNVTLLIFGADARPIPLSYGFDSFLVGPIIVDKVRLYAATAAL